MPPTGGDSYDVWCAGVLSTVTDGLGRVEAAGAGAFVVPAGADVVDVYGNEFVGRAEYRTTAGLWAVRLGLERATKAGAGKGSTVRVLVAAPPFAVLLLTGQKKSNYADTRRLLRQIRSMAERFGSVTYEVGAGPLAAQVEALADTGARVEAPRRPSLVAGEVIVTHVAPARHRVKHRSLPRNQRSDVTALERLRLTAAAAFRLGITGDAATVAERLRSEAVPELAAIWDRPPGVTFLHQMIRDHPLTWADAYRADVDA